MSKQAYLETMFKESIPISCPYFTAKSTEVT